MSQNSIAIGNAAVNVSNGLRADGLVLLAAPGEPSGFAAAAQAVGQWLAYLFQDGFRRCVGNECAASREQTKCRKKAKAAENQCGSGRPSGGKR